MGYTFDLKKMGPEQSLEARKRELDVACARDGEKIRVIRNLQPHTGGHGNNYFVIHFVICPCHFFCHSDFWLSFFCHLFVILLVSCKIRNV